MIRAVLRGIKAVYNFFAGDAIILVAVVLAFAAAFAIARVLRANALGAAAFLLLIVAGLTATLARERMSRSRTGGARTGMPR